MKDTLNSLPFNWFDVAVAAVLIAGFFRGRKRGMSEELLPMIQWLIIVSAGAFFYEPLGGVLADLTPFSRLFCYVTAYILIGVVTKVFFVLVKHLLKGKLIGSDVFGKTEYYLGMMAGVVRFSCGLLAVLAVLNARLYTKQEIAADRRYQIEQFDNEFFPKLYSLQEQVFESSALGPHIKDVFGSLLIKPTPPENRGVRRPGEWNPNNP